MLILVLFSALIVESLGVVCIKDRSGRYDAAAFSVPIENIRLQPGYNNWQLSYVPICPNAVLEVKVCDDVKPQLIVYSPWRASIVRRGARGPKAVVKGKWWCLPGTVDESKLMYLPVANPLKI